jgi:hypothetical protein
MTSIERDTRRQAPRIAVLLRQISGRITSTVAELNYAQRRATELFVGLDGYMVKPARPAATFGDFLARTSGRLVHEPSARDRHAGETVR